MVVKAQNAALSLLKSDWSLTPSLNWPTLWHLVIQQLTFNPCLRVLNECVHVLCVCGKDYTCHPGKWKLKSKIVSECIYVSLYVQHDSSYLQIMEQMKSSYKYGDAAAAVWQMDIVSHQSQFTPWQGHISAWLPQNEEINQQTSYSSYIWTVFVWCIQFFWVARSQLMLLKMLQWMK